MKRFLILSVLFNVVLACVVIWFVQQRPTASMQTSSVQLPDARTNRAPANAEPSPAAAMPTPEAQKPMQLFDWRMVESEDYKKYIANLRAIGCPEETIRDIITADVNKLFESRSRGLSKFQFWKADNFWANPNRVEKSVEVWKEKRALLKELLGVEPEGNPTDIFAGYHPLERMLDFLPPEKQSQVMEIQTLSQAKLQKLGKMGPIDARALAEAQKERETEVAKVLTPQEFEEYQLHMSDTAMSLRSQLAAFDATEQEFRDIFKVQKQFDDAYGALGRESSYQSLEYNTALKEKDAQLKSILGESRYGDYKRSQDSEYQSIYRITELNGLPKDSAVRVYDMRNAALNQANNVRNDKSLAPEQRAAALQGIRAETENSIQTVLGDNAWKAYQSQPNTYWLRNISPDSAHEP